MVNAATRPNTPPALPDRPVVPRTTIADTPDAARIETPEQVALTLPLAGVGSRLLAALLDALVVGAGVVASLIVGAFFGLFLAAQDSGENAGEVLLALYAVLLVAGVFGYFAGLELLWNGQTVGKRALGIRVLRDDGSPVDTAAVLARTVVRLVDFLPVGYLVGLVSMVADGRGRRLGDIVGGTIVVREGGGVPTLREIGGVADLAAWPLAPHESPAPVDKLNEDELAAAREFLRRSTTFAPRERAALAWRVAVTLAARMGYTTPPPEPEWFLVWVVRSAAQRGDG